MPRKTQADFAITFSRLQKLNSQLITMSRSGTSENISFQKRISLFKRYKRYLKKIISVEHPLSKAIAVFAVAMLLNAESEGQAPCNRFVHANESNPLKRAALPITFRTYDPVFVDIDNDGDLDCYEIYQIPGNYNTDSTRFVFLKNIGSKTLPVFQYDSTGGFPTTTDMVYAGDVSGPVFVWI